MAVEEYSGVVASLRHAYGPAAAAERDGREKEAFKVDERRRFLDLLRARGATSLLEVGAGTGHDSLYFQRQGLRVVCTDLSPAMVELCRAKGLDARVADFLGLGVPPASFDAVYAMNCLLHVPTPDLARVLEAIGEVLVPGGLFYAGTWGGVDEEGPVRDDRHPVPRFFAFRSDRRMREALAGCFRVLSFTTVDADGNHFQSFVLEKPGTRFRKRRTLTPRGHQQRRIADQDVDGEARSWSHRAAAGHRSNPATRYRGMIFAAERWRQPRQKSRNRLSATARDAGDPAPAPVSIIAERTMLSGDGQYGLQRPRRPADQEPDVIEAHLEQPPAEPVLPGPVPSGPGPRRKRRSVLV